MSLFQCHLEMEKSPGCFLSYSSVGEGQVVAAGGGRRTARAWGEGRLWTHRSHQGEGGVEAGRALVLRRAPRAKMGGAGARVLQALRVLVWSLLS